MLAITVGLVFVALGLWGIVGWWAEFVTVIKGALPIMIFLGGLLAVVAGASSVRDSMNEKSGAAKNNDDVKQ